jgi:hypothetical protein
VNGEGEKEKDDESKNVGQRAYKARVYVSRSPKIVISVGPCIYRAYTLPSQILLKDLRNLGTCVEVLRRSIS